MWRMQTENEKLDWHNDWADWIEAGDQISQSVWSIDKPDPSSDAVLTSPTIATFLTTVFVSNLKLGHSYRLWNKVTTTGGRIGEREITLRCERS